MGGAIGHGFQVTERRRRACAAVSGQRSVMTPHTVKLESDTVVE